MGITDRQPLSAYARTRVDMSFLRPWVAILHTIDMVVQNTDPTCGPQFTEKITDVPQARVIPAIYTKTTLLDPETHPASPPSCCLNSKESHHHDKIVGVFNRLLDEFAKAFLNDIFDSSKDQALDIRDRSDSLADYSPVDEFQAHAARRIADPGMGYPPEQLGDACWKIKHYTMWMGRNLPDKKPCRKTAPICNQEFFFAAN